VEAGKAGKLQARLLHHFLHAAFAIMHPNLLQQHHFFVLVFEMFFPKALLSLIY
jgi:hypothetical protein